ncbi:MAG: right-handed parallel beta-helix repeat-containing protein [Actinomycetota bacterium]|nr:right-handed parallel beta-helix repeat-containing protein [Actinomycetota bacterium]
MKFSRVIGLASIGGLAVLGTVGVSPASAATKTIKCGTFLSGNVTAANSIGPCPVGDAIKISASGTVLNLAGHSIQCSNFDNHLRKEQVGVHIMGASNVTVKNGSVYDCDAGVAIEGGANNTVSGITAHDNVAHVLVSGPVNPDNPLTTPCNFGDGITTLSSSGNHITGNLVYSNGPFSGISLVDNSDNNMVTGNQVYQQNIPNLLPPPAPAGTNGPCGPFSATPQGQGRADQDIGIRVEGPGADNNQVVGNQVHDNMLDGITVHGYVCLNGAGPTPPPGLPPRGTSNTGTLIKGNSVFSNGFDLDQLGQPVPGGSAQGQDGIAILRQGPFGVIVCASHDTTIIGNSSTNNARYGIFVPPTGDQLLPAHNTVNANLVNNNGLQGIHVDGPFLACPLGHGTDTGPTFCNVVREIRPGSIDNTLVGNQGSGNGTHIVGSNIGGRDGWDGNVGCDNNHWVANIFGTVNQACVAANGGTGTPIGPIPTTIIPT